MLIMYCKFVQLFALIAVSLLNYCVTIGQPVLSSGASVLTFEQKTRIFNEIIKIVEMETDEGFVSCKKLEVYTCVAVYEITTLTIHLKDLYLSIVNMENNINALEIQNFVIQLKLGNNIDKILYLECIKIIAKNLSVDKYEMFLDYIIRNPLAIKSLNNFLINIESTAIVTSNYTLKIWHPYESNVSGITLYNDPSNKPFIKEIYMNHSHNIDTSGALLSAYVPERMLRNLSYNLSHDMKKKIRVIMLFIRMSKCLRNEFQVSRDMRYLIGIAIPELCKRNYLPMVFASFSPYSNNSDLWSQFGANYFDRLTYSGYRCVLDRMSYFGEIGHHKYNSLRNDYCLVTAFDKTTLKNISWAVPTNQPIFTPYLCINNYYDIMSTYCSVESPREFYVDYTCLEFFSMSHETERLYQVYMACVYNKNDCLNLFTHCPSFIDALLQNNILWLKAKSNLSGIKDRSLIVKCFEEILLYTPNHQLMFYISILLDLIDFSDKYIQSNSAYKYISIQNSKMNQGAVYRDKKFQRISTNAFREISFVPKADITALALLEQNEAFSSSIDFVVIDNSVLTNYGSNVCRSDVIGVKVTCEFCDSINFTIFLRIRYGIYNGWGYWYWITVDKGAMTLFCIAAQSASRCSYNDELLMFQKPLRTKEYINNSQFIRGVWTFNPSFNSFKFRYLSEISSVISAISGLCIFNLISFVVYRGWYKKKFYTVQICIAQFFQLGPFLPHISTLQVHLVFSAWYYGYLTELTWIFIYIYTAYMKFVGTMYSASKRLILIMGWVIPAIILIIYNQVDTLCWECSFCYKADSILMQFIAIPFTLIVLVNLIIFIVTKIQIRYIVPQKRTNINKANIRAAFIISIFFAICVPILVIIASISMFPLTPFYIYYCILPSQGFLLFVLFIFLKLQKKNKK